jgi:hypothetical protein
MTASTVELRMDCSGEGAMVYRRADAAAPDAAPAQSAGAVLTRNPARNLEPGIALTG